MTILNSPTSTTGTQRPSLFGRLAEEPPRDASLDARIEREIRGALARHIVDEGPVAELSHVVLAGLVALLVSPAVSQRNITAEDVACGRHYALCEPPDRHWFVKQ